MQDPTPDGAQGTREPGALLSYAPAGEGGDRVLVHPSRPRWMVGNATTEQIARILNAPGGCVESAAAFLEGQFGLPSADALRDAQYVQDQLARQGMLGTAPSPSEDRPRFGSLSLIITERCNLACAHCWGSFPAHGELPLNTLLRLVDEFEAGGGRQVILSGGEPLLYPGLKQVLARIGRRMTVVLGTNGILLDEAWGGLLAREHDAQVQISLDGPTAAIHDAVRGPGAFAGALRGIHHLLAAGMGSRLGIAATIQGANHRHLPELARLVADLGIPRLRLIPLRKKGRALETLDRTGEGLDPATYEAIFNQVYQVPSPFPPRVQVSCGLTGFDLMPDEGGRTRCPLGGQLVVGPGGDVFPCTPLMRDDCRLGNVHASSLREIVEGARMRELHTAKLVRKDVISACGACQWQSLCQSGCMAEALEETGSFWEVDGRCDYRQRLYARTFDLLLGGVGPAGDEA